MPERSLSRISLSPIKISPDTDKTDGSGFPSSPSFSPVRPLTPRGMTPLSYRSSSRNCYTPVTFVNSLMYPEDTYTSLKSEFSSLKEALQTPSEPASVVDRYKLAYEIEALKERVQILQQRASGPENDHIRVLHTEIHLFAERYGCIGIAKERIQKEGTSEQELFPKLPPSEIHALVEQKILLAEAFLKASLQALEVHEELSFLPEEEAVLKEKIETFKQYVQNYGPRIGMQRDEVELILEGIDNPETRFRTADMVRQNLMPRRRDGVSGIEKLYTGVNKVLGEISEVQERVSSIERSHKKLQDLLLAIPETERRLLARDLKGNQTPDGLARDIVKSPAECSWEDASHLTAHAVCFRRAEQEFASSASLYRSTSAAPSPFFRQSPLPPINS